MEGIPKNIVFSTDSLITYLCDGPGSNEIETYLVAVEGTSNGYISTVNLVEVMSIVQSVHGSEYANIVTDTIQESGIKQIETGDLCEYAAKYRSDYELTLSESFALGTAEQVDGSLLTRSNISQDAITNIHIIYYEPS